MEESWASSDHARRTMQANRRRDTKPELALRSTLHSRGLRFRVDAVPFKGVRTRADVVFSRAKIAVFVDGCFWHGCPEHFIMPKTNTNYWSSKISSNRDRDERVDGVLGDEGWLVIRVWEHEDPASAATRIERAWRSRTGQA
ncbi:very short patch repair endonuclease [Brevibacterium atlanticum]|uniref:very short patch repair endonuclease n=1 Tax=Brevibacterium atlanticum TaxID=2697563 RepID=UPI001422D246|nr:very short patch repair endonuclease [Brevibacterium atlanticum]